MFGLKLKSLSIKLKIGDTKLSLNTNDIQKPAIDF